jgi:hypothetical protein
MAIYIFSTDIYVGAESEDEARDGLLDLLADIVRDDDSRAFDLISTEVEADA